MSTSQVEEKLKNLSPAKRELLLRRLREQASRGVAGESIGRRPESSPAVLSFAQERLWFLQQLEPGSPHYNMPAHLGLQGELDVPALEQSLREVVRRHEVLRITIQIVGGRAVPVAGEVDLHLPLVDLSGLPAEAVEPEARRLAHEEGRRPFALDKGPLVRATLVRRGSREHGLLLTVHHVVSDGWSTGILVREVTRLYEARVSGREAQLPELPIQYSDFAHWQRQWLQGEALERQLGYWRERLAGDLAVLELPADRARPAVWSYRGARCRLRFGSGLIEPLAELGRREGASLFMVLLAGFQALLARYTGQTDILVGSPVANRTREEIEGLIGCFVNTLVMRTDLSADPPFRGLLGRVREVAMGAYAHQDLPIEKLVEEIQPERHLSRQALFQVIFSLQAAGRESFSLPGVTARLVEQDLGTARLDLVLILTHGEDGISGSVEFSTELFDRTRIERMVRHLESLLAGVAGEPDLPVSELPLLSGAERHQLLVEWNDTEAELTPERTLQELFERQAALQPDALAVVWRGEEIRYGELEARANRLARHLRSLGVGRGSQVGVWMGRRPELIVSLLGILKAGGSYVPLETGWPEERAKTILSLLGVECLLTDRARLRRLHEIGWSLPRLRSMVCMDETAPQVAAEAVDEEEVRRLWDHVAERAVDRVTAGGFVSSYTGRPFTEREVDEYVARLVGLAQDRVRPGARVLEIGCGSGLILFELAQRGARCVGLDPSEPTQERNRERVAAEGWDVELVTGFAHELEERVEGCFDLIVIASAAQFFPGPRYMEGVIETACRRLAPGGALLLGDIVDVRSRDEFRLSLEEFARDHQADSEIRTKSRFDELCFAPDFFADVAARLGAEVRVHERGDSFANELRFRYDVVLEKSGGEARPPARQVWTRWHLEGLPGDPLDVVNGPGDTVYTLFTSGSTGVPKGVVVRHGAAVNLVHWVNRGYAMGPGDRGLFVTSVCFDLSVYDMFGMLGAGGTVRIADEEDLQNPERLVRALCEEPITFWSSAPPMMQQLVPVLPTEPVPGRALRLVFLSGDWIPLTLPDRLRAAFPGVPIVNLGGATETTVWANFYSVDHVDPRWPNVPYGRPITNARYYVLDAGYRPLPIGVVGDLYAAGVCLSTGYARDPVLTAQRFVPDPFGPPGSRMYDMGDRGRFFADGNMEFLGRRDHQVKVRGYRIELGEIEVALTRCPGVREAVVLVREAAAGDLRLVAYVVGEADREDLRARLQESLPEYMLPSAFVFLDGLPVTANGKLDRKALPEPDWDGSGERAERVGASTPVEEVLLGIWEEVLGVSGLGVHDGFFDLGGHSLLATRVVARVRESLGVDLPLRSLFTSPTVASLAPQVESALRESTGLESAPIVPVERQGDLPPSFAQERLWFIEQLERGTGTYNIPLAVRLRGRLSVLALERSLEEVARRHETLRTVFGSRQGRPVQAVLPEGPRGLPVVDLGGLSPESQAGLEARNLARDEAARPFDLEAGPLVRWRLLRLTDTGHVLLLTVHHIVSDGWSTGVLAREIEALYQAFSQGRPSPLAELPVQYADYAAWQRRWLSDEVLEGQLAYWRKRLADSAEAAPLLELPTDRPRPAVQSYLGARLTLTIPEDLTAALRVHGKSRGATLFMSLMAGFGALLGRHANQQTVRIGSPVAGRGRTELEGLIGFFVNTLVLAVELEGEPGFGALLDRVRESALGAYAHQDVPFERLVEELAPQRSLAYTPLFQVVLALNPPRPQLALAGLAAEPFGADLTLEKFDVTLFISESGDRLEGVLSYAADLFDAATMHRLSDQWLRLLAAAVAAPERSTGDLEVLSPAERHQLLAEWNDTGAPPAGGLLHDGFQAWAAAYPDDEAVIFEGTSVTYGELDRRSRQLAAWLQTLGVGPEVPVGVCLDRTPDLLVALLGVLAAGGAYVPLDPAYPAERLELMLGDSGAPVLLTRSALLGRVPGYTGRAVCLDQGLPAAPGRSLSTRTSPGNLAYVIYTSGSTGRPKGVAVEHRSAAALMRWSGELFGAELHEVLASTSICFDVSVFELFAPLSHGGRMTLVRDPLALSGLPDTAPVGLVCMVPSVIAELVRARAIPKSVRTVGLGGEAVARALVRDLHEAGVRRVLNMYGPSEATTYTTVGEIEGGTDRIPSIGRPITGLEVYLVDRFYRPVPLGVAGELLVGGLGLARGYLGRPELTAERFVPNPFGVPGERLYRTGDLVRARTDGRFEYLGRIDHQVKVRGFRVELGEVEAALLRYPGVREAVAVVREAAAGDRRLVSYVTAGPGEPVDGQALREHLAEELPEFMVPSGVVVLAELPRTPNGKVDRKALPEPEWGRAQETGKVAPRGPVEEMIAAIWEEILGIEGVGAHDVFFDLGGHSLLATQVVSRLRDAFGVELPLRALFADPTVASLAAHIEEARQAGFAPELPPLVPAARDELIPLSFAQQRLWFLHSLQPASVASYNIPLAVRLRGPLDATALERSLDEVVRRHESLRTSFRAVEGTPVQVIAPELRVPLVALDLRDLPAELRDGEARRLAQALAAKPFALDQPPLMRGLVLRLDEAEWVLFLAMHHLVSDGWSTGVLMRELGALYNLHAHGAGEPLPPLPVQYADFTLWQRGWLQGEVLEGQISYWREHLQGVPPLDLPSDRVRPAVQTFSGALRRSSLSEDVLEDLRHLVRREGVTSFMVLASAYAALLHRYSEQVDFAIGTPVANRRLSEVEPLIGFFVNTLVLRLNLSGAPSFRELTSRVRDAALGAYAHQDVPFERLVEELQPDRDLSRPPLFQVSFAFQNLEELELGLPGLEVERFEYALQGSKFDLNLTVQEGRDTLRTAAEYSTDLFDHPTMGRLLEQFGALLETALREPDLPVRRLPLLTAVERHQMLAEWNDTAAPYPVGSSVHEWIEEQVRRTPGALAVTCHGCSYTYGELNARANRLARHLRGLGIGLGDFVGIWLSRGLDMVTAMLGILKSGAAYAPLDPAWPDDRRSWILASLKVPCVVTESTWSRRSQDALWGLPDLKHLIYMDVEAPELPVEPVDVRTVQDLWDHIAERASDRESAAGFVSSYTGGPFPEAEVDEYRDRVLDLTRPHVSPGARVLEIGCGSGLITFPLAASIGSAGRYVALDPSGLTQRRNREAAAREGLSNVEWVTGFAHEIDRLEAGSFDLVLIASTVQFFPGLRYLAEIVRLALDRLAPGGRLVIADVLDLSRREEYRRSLEEFREQHRHDPEIRTKTDLSQELYVDPGFFHDLASRPDFAAAVAVADIEVLPRLHGFPNELRFRYDLVLHKQRSGEERPGDFAGRPGKSVWTAAALAGHADGDLPNITTPKDLAYVIFTSGSTGLPKGVLEQHDAVMNLIRWINGTFGIGPQDRMLFVASICFDLSVYDVFGLLAAGGSIQVATDDDLRDPDRLVHMLRTDPVTFWDSAPAALQQLAPLFPPPPGPGEPVPALRLVFQSGDWIPLALPDQVRKAFPRARVMGLGGATEATVWSNFFPIGEVNPAWRSIPYGRPIPNARYHVLDRNLSPCPIGVPGDLYIGDLCLAAGYTDPIQSASRFIPDPLGAVPGARLYFTGDRARYYADGNLEFLGRLDHQVKIRGYRIELGEIDAVIGSHPGVREKVVAVRPDATGEKRLVAYVAPREPQESSQAFIASLRAHMGTKLPGYMIPSAFVVLEALPVSANGKVDRKALPEPDWGGGAASETAYVAPQTPLERVLAGSWEELLGLERVGLHDSFFDLGGHSLLAVRLFAFLREGLQVDLPMRTLFSAPTVAELAAVILADEGQRARAEKNAELLLELAETDPESLAPVPVQPEGAPQGPPPA